MFVAFIPKRLEELVKTERYILANKHDYFYRYFHRCI